MYIFDEFKYGDPCLILESGQEVLLEFENHCIDHNEVINEFVGHYRTHKECEYQKYNEAKA